MKKTFNINIAGFPFTIDDDAYSLLSEYLDTIKHAFSNLDESKELTDDIERRIAELLLEYTSSGSPIVTSAQVEDVIRRIGKPEEMLEEETVSLESENNDTPPPFSQKDSKTRKRLYRDPQNAMLGGVCSGLGWYLNCDPTWIRLATVLLTFASVSTCGLVYIVLWIVLPEAKTPIERMQMMGESPTIENIGKTVTDSFKEDNGTKAPQQRPSDSSSSFANGLSNTFGLMARLLIIIGLIIGLPILIGLALALIGCVFTLIMFGTSTLSGFSYFGTLSDSDAKTVIYGIVTGIGFILFLGIPLFMLIRKGIWPNAKPLPKASRWLLSILCTLGFLTAAFSTGKIIDENTRGNRYFNFYGNDIIKIETSPEQKAEKAREKALREEMKAENARAAADKARERLERAKELAAQNPDKQNLKELKRAEKAARKAIAKAEKALHKADMARMKAELAEKAAGITYVEPHHDTLSESTLTVDSIASASENVTPDSSATAETDDTPNIRSIGIPEFENK